MGQHCPQLHMYQKYTEYNQELSAASAQQQRHRRTVNPKSSATVFQSTYQFLQPYYKLSTALRLSEGQTISLLAYATVQR
jgi:hypothetical protein